MRDGVVSGGGRSVTYGQLVGGKLFNVAIPMTTQRPSEALGLLGTTAVGLEPGGPGAKPISEYRLALTKDVLFDTFAKLVAKSVVVRTDEAGRYRLLEPIRQFGSQRLDHAGEAFDIGQRHLAWCTALVLGGGRRWWDGSTELALAQRLVLEADNFGAAFTFAARVPEAKEACLDALCELAAVVTSIRLVRDIYDDLQRLLETRGAIGLAVQARALLVAGTISLRAARDGQAERRLNACHVLDVSNQRLGTLEMATYGDVSWDGEERAWSIV